MALGRAREVPPPPQPPSDWPLRPHNSSFIQKQTGSEPPHVCLFVMVHMGGHCHVHMVARRRRLEAVAAHVDHDKQTNMGRSTSKIFLTQQSAQAQYLPKTNLFCIKSK